MYYFSWFLSVLYSKIGHIVQHLFSKHELELHNETKHIRTKHKLPKLTDITCQLILNGVLKFSNGFRLKSLQQWYPYAMKIAFNWFVFNRLKCNHVSIIQLQIFISYHYITRNILHVYLYDSLYWMIKHIIHQINPLQSNLPLTLYYSAPILLYCRRQQLVLQYLAFLQENISSISNWSFLFSNLALFHRIPSLSGRKTPRNLILNLMTCFDSLVHSSFLLHPQKTSTFHIEKSLVLSHMAKVGLHWSWVQEFWGLKNCAWEVLQLILKYWKDSLLNLSLLISLVLNWF